MDVKNPHDFPGLFLLHSILRQFSLLVCVGFLLGRFQVHYRVHSPAKVKRVSSVKRKGCPVVGVGSKLHRKASDVSCAHDCSMANKENELTCSDDIRRNCSLPGNSGEASKMAGASSKYSDFTEVRADHSFYYYDTIRWLKMFRLRSLSSASLQLHSYACLFSYRRTMKRWLTSFLEGISD